MLAQLSSLDWPQKALDDVVRRADACFSALSIKLGDRKYFMGNEPTELDALVFGHCFSILTTELPSMHLANALRKYTNLCKYCRNVETEFFGR